MLATPQLRRLLTLYDNEKMSFWLALSHGALYARAESRDAAETIARRNLTGEQGSVRLIRCTEAVYKALEEANDAWAYVVGQIEFKSADERDDAALVEPPDPNWTADTE